MILADIELLKPVTNNDVARVGLEKIKMTLNKSTEK